jgi:hypothetical protein
VLPSPDPTEESHVRTFRVRIDVTEETTDTTGVPGELPTIGYVDVVAVEGGCTVEATSPRMLAKPVAAVVDQVARAATDYLVRHLEGEETDRG